MAKVRADIFEDKITYRVQSKSLTDALQRAIVIVEAVGPRLAGFEYTLNNTRKKPRHVFYIDA